MRNSPKKEEDTSIKEAFYTMNGAEADYNFSIWVGAICFYLINLRKNPFKFYEQRKFSKRNVWVGYFLKLIIVGVFMFLL